MELGEGGTGESKLITELHKLRFAKCSLPDIHVFSSFSYTRGVTQTNTKRTISHSLSNIFSVSRFLSELYISLPWQEQARPLAKTRSATESAPGAEQKHLLSCPGHDFSERPFGHFPLTTANSCTSRGCKKGNN